ncbi:hypothetical protein LR48_Vigan10g069600 [Vigna angularis]|uniref:C2H2-type domain-containing protein n=1 Tax=Phaseolus angularis TaxID=3914 RepID=A0A0L9VJ88_PHAAN|nr:uncharacterized protein HKW66_Vig0180050 [Vigna angularis]KOM54804.1 hypothetical protein LR48_Vigan10g069600 [Vigna angularis]
MDLSGKRISVSGEGSSSNGGAGGSNLQLVPYSENKKVCPFCQREFKCGKSLGGHIKVHKKSRRTLKFTHKKKSNRRGIGSSSALTIPTPLNVVRVCEIVAPLRIVENGASGAAVTTLRILANGASGVEEPLRIDETGASGGEIHDMSMSLVGCGWKTKGRRGSNEETEKLMRANHYSYSDDEYEECDVEDSCDEDDYDNIKLRKWLRSRGYGTGAHKICWTKRMLMCKVCNQYFRTLSGVISHVDECALTNSEVEMEREGSEENGRLEVDQAVDNAVGEVVAKMPEDAPVTKHNGVSSSSSSVQHKHLQLDLNQTPPPEED